jgi:deoxyribodipyrimidine photo-lyase
MSSIFLFHRDFRTIDNTSLIALSRLSKSIHPIFILTPEQVDPSKNPYYNERIILFMMECMLAIPHLQIFYGDTIDVLESLFKLNDITHIGFNLDYTPYAKKRTERIQKLAKAYNVAIVAHEDYTTLEMNKFRDAGHYKVFKPFYENLLKQEVPSPETKNIATYLSPQRLKCKSEFRIKSIKQTPDTHREDALAILRDRRLVKNYAENRNIPSIDTTHLSKYIKFGVVSIREVFHAYRTHKTDADLLRQVVWHDFYASLMHFTPPRDTIGGGNLQHKKQTWTSKNTLFRKWCEGNTGFPLVDAGMRQLNETGWMHNRVRLIVSNFLTMTLEIDWHKGEKYFAQQLIDYDVSSNNLNWQFSAQVGTDRNPFVRIYNPFLQSQKYDPEAVYIKRWVPELRDVPVKDIHKWNVKWEGYKNVYVKPIIKY